MMQKCLYLGKIVWVFRNNLFTFTPLIFAPQKLKTSEL